MSSWRTIFKEKKKEENSMDNVEKEDSEKAGYEKRKMKESDSRVGYHCQERPRVRTEKDPLHLAARTLENLLPKTKIQ